MAEKWNPEYKEESLTLGNIAETNIRGFDYSRRTKELNLGAGRVRLRNYTSGTVLAFSLANMSSFQQPGLLVFSNDNAGYAQAQLDSGTTNATRVRFGVRSTTNDRFAFSTRDLIPIPASGDPNPSLGRSGNSWGTVWVDKIVFSAVTSNPVGVDGMVYYNDTFGSLMVFTNGTFRKLQLV